MAERELVYALYRDPDGTYVVVDRWGERAGRGLTPSQALGDAAMKLVDEATREALTKRYGRV